jgi:hypothetical protein
LPQGLSNYRICDRCDMLFQISRQAHELECVPSLQAENTRLRGALEDIATSLGARACSLLVAKAKAALGQLT